MSDEVGKHSKGIQDEPAVGALTQYMDIREDIAALEGSRCSCEDFSTCDLCDEMKAKEAAARNLVDSWADSWAALLHRATLPFRTWCECGHISGQHAAKYPHACAVDRGCETKCYGFRPRVKAPELAEALRALLEIIRRGDLASAKDVETYKRAEKLLSEVVG